MANKEKDEKKSSSRSGSAGKTSATKKNARKADVDYDTYDGYDYKKDGKKGTDLSSPKYFAISLVLGALAIFTVACFGFPEYCGFLGEVTKNVLFGIFGGGALLVPVLLFAEALFLKRDAKNGKIWYRPVFSLLGIFTVCALLHAAFALGMAELGGDITQITPEKIAGFYNYGMGLTGGGVVGGLLGTLIMSAVGITGTIILAVLLILFCGIFIFGFTPRTFVKTVRYKYFSIKEKIAIRKQEKAEAAAAAREEKMQAEAIARKREERRRAEIAEQEREEREREEAENREIDRMRQNAQAHNARASEIRRENARARTVAKTAGGAEASKVKKKPVYEDDFDTEETPRAGKHGDIDDIFSADFIDGGKKKAPARAAQKPAEEEEDKEFRGSSVADFWRKNEADTETTFEELPEEDMPEGALTEEYAEEYGEEVIEPMETGESFEDEAGEEVFSCPTYESAFAGVTSEEDEIELPEEAEDEELPDDVIPWEDLTGEKTQKKTGDPVADELRRTLDVTRKKIQENAAREGAGAKTAPATTMQMQEMPEAVIPEEPVYVFPPLDLLKKDPGKSGGNEEEELHANAEKLVATLKSFNVRAKIVDVSRGPTITRYEIGLEAGTRVRTIMNLVDDISYALATNGVRIEGVIPGKSAIGIEVPNTGVRDTVYLRSLLEDKKFTDAKSKLTTALGKSVSGDNVYLDIAKMPHLLIAGTTGSGKSVCINTMLISLLYKATPDEVKLVLVDPKKVELNVYNGIPHLLVPVVFDPKKAAGALHWCVTEMERRFDLIESMNVRNIEGYNKAIEDDPTKEKLPQIVIVIDELADLMMTASNEVETSICRIAQKARAAGMHLIIGTQRPSVDVITGLIKANVPSRIAFTVMSQVDSRTIIDSVGAEKLIGRGDMLYAPVGASKPMRAQGAFVSDAELEGIIDFIKENAKKAEYSDEIMNRIEKEAALCGKKGKAREEAEEQDEGGDEEDPKLESAIKLAVESGKISTSLIQRKLSLGYGRAAKIIDVMERRGIVGAPEGQKPREVLITKEQYLEMQMRSGGAAGATAQNEERTLTSDDFPEDEI